MATGAAQNVGRPEYMNATPHHSKIRVSLALSSPLFVAGQDVTGKMEMECRSDKGVGIGLVMVEMFAIQELNSRDHSASSTFLHTRRLFQGPGLPPSNAVVAHPTPGQSPLPQGHFPARRGVTTFFFRFPVPLSSPSSVSFASGLAKVRYEVRASVGVAHRGEKRVVTDNAEADVVQCEDMDGTVAEHVVVGENGKMYVQGRIVGGRIISGQQACVELRVKNQSSKKTTGLSLTLTRTLHLHDAATTSRAPLQLSDTLFTQNFRGTEFSVQAGAEGVANLVFDVPKAARVVKGGIREGADDDEGGRRRTEPLFEIQCILGVKIGMGIASKDVVFEMPVQLSHPATLPDPPPSSDPYAAPGVDPYAMAPPDPFYGHQSPRAMSPVFEPPNPYFARSSGPGSGTSSPSYAYASPPIPSSSASPSQHPYYHSASPVPPYAYPASSHQHLWSPPPPAISPLPYFTPDPHQAYYFPPPPVPLVPFAYPTRPNSAGAGSLHDVPHVASGLPSGLPGVGSVGPVYPTFQQQQQHQHQLQPHDFPQDQDPHLSQDQETAVEPRKDVGAAEEGKGERASRISRHLRTSTRARSVSPMSHRFPGAPSAPAAAAVALHATSPRHHDGPPLLSPRPVLSPRQSFSADVGTGTSPPDAAGTARSGRVDLLERMVDPAPGEEGKSVEEVLRDLEKAEQEKQKELDKTLPKPPVSSGKVQASRRASGVPRASDVFGLQAVKEKDETASASGDAERPAKSVLRPSPMARRISADGKEKEKDVAKEQGKGLLRPEPVQRSSGLDALEKRLLYEVGTRKPDKPDRPTVLGLETVTPASAATRTTSASTRLRANDSEISSLALASNGGSTERRNRADSNTNSVPPSATPRAEQEYEKAKERVLRAVGVDKDRAPAKHKDRAREDKTREHEALKLRKAAKGRVADWLGGVAVSPEPESEAKAKDSDSPLHMKTSDSGSTKQDASPPNVTASADVRAVPPSRNTDPKPIDTPSKAAKPKALQSPIIPSAPFSRSPELKSPRVRDKPASLDLKPLSLKPAADGSRSPPFTPPPLALPKPPALVSPRLRPSISPTNASPPVENTPRVIAAPEPDKPAICLTKFPLPQLAPETRYDVRSARGGKGGITTSVAAIWSSLADERGKERPTTPPSKQAAPVAPKRPAFLDVGRAKASPTPTKSPLNPSPTTTTTTTPPTMAEPQPVRNMVKSASVPAAVVSSHARPHLSSTASLARPALASSKSKPPLLSPTLTESPSEESSTKALPVAAGEMAFGQARLKDLIKKYQQAAS